MSPGTRMSGGPPLRAVALAAAGAGCATAFRQLVLTLRKDLGVAWLLLHEDDGLDSEALAKALEPHTDLPVGPVDGPAELQADHVYVTAGPLTLSRRGSAVTAELAGSSDPNEPRLDPCFERLSVELGPRAIGLVLTGGASPGSSGLQALQAHGALTLAQLPETAEHDHMPRQAILSGAIDFVLPIDDMVEAVAHHLDELDLTGGAGEFPVLSRDELSAVLGVLRVRTDHDFRHYKRPTLVRRIGRRMGLGRHDSAEGYLERLRDDPAEVETLFKDLMIGVTGFFREPHAWSVLQEEVIRPLVADASNDDVLRAWVAGCATGEEAYSLGLLFLEALDQAGKSTPVQVFATDTLPEALDAARAGVYDTEIEPAVGASRLERYFTPVSEGWRVSKRLRESVVFAHHNLLSDPPFSRLDLVSCRNLLIYLTPEVQQRLVRVWHFALREGGRLFLGTSETVGQQRELFEPISKKWRIYRRIGPTRLGWAALGPARVLEPPPYLRGHRAARHVAPGELARQALLREFAPPAVLIDESLEIVYIQGDVSHVLALPSGEPTRELLALTPQALTTKLRGAIRKASQDGQRVTFEAALDQSRLSVTVLPFDRALRARRLILVVFDSHAQTEPGLPKRPATADHLDDNLVQQLEYELRSTRADLQATIEELESSNEELKAANEEVMSMNEELQSTNEELETSKEELQSLNEELTTVNARLQENVEELESTNNDLANLLASTDVATLFLDETLCIKRYTPAATQLVRLIASDVGRPLGDIARSFRDDRLIDDAREVLDRLTPREAEVVTTDGRFFLRRIVPYRTHDNRIDGVVVTFIDVDALRRADASVRESEAQLQQMADSLPLVVLYLDLAHVLQFANLETRRWFGAGRTLVGQSAAELLGSSWPHLRLAVERAGRGQSVALDTRLSHPRLGLRDVGIHCVAHRDSGGEVAGVYLVADDISDRLRAEAEARKVQARIQETQKLESLGVLTGGIAHDFNNLLVAIMANAELVTATPDLNDTGREHLLQVTLAAQRASELCGQMLAYAGRSNALLEAVHLSELVREMAELLGVTFSANIVLESHLDPALPTVEGDAAQLRQVVMNLVMNAAEAIVDEPGTIRLRTGVDRFSAVDFIDAVVTEGLVDDRYVYLEVEDDGIGMDEATQHRIFEPFFTTKFTGRGLGMAAVLGIIKAHQGTLTVRSEPGAGTRFRVFLPVLREAATRRFVAPTSRPWSGRGLVLVVDDEPTVLVPTRRALELHGLEVLTAQAGDEALQLALLHGDRIDLVLLDRTMPGMPGEDVAMSLAALRPELPIVVMSGYSEEQAMRRFTVPIAGFLQKPWLVEGLIAIVRRVLSEAGSS